jgi:class 3 adenylate cyclase
MKVFANLPASFFRVVIPLTISVASGYAADQIVRNFDWPNHLEKAVQLDRFASSTIPASDKILIVAVTPETYKKFKRADLGELLREDMLEIIQLLDKHERVTLLFDFALQRPLDPKVPRTPIGLKYERVTKTLKRLRFVPAVQFVLAKDHADLYTRLEDDNEPSGTKAYTHPISVWDDPPTDLVCPALVEYLPVDDVAFGACLVRHDHRTNRQILYAPLAAIILDQGIHPSAVRIDPVRGFVQADHLRWQIDGNHSVDVRYASESNPFETVELYDAVQKLRKGDAKQFQGRIAILGEFEGSDSVNTAPFGSVDGVLFNAHMVNTLMRESSDRTWFGSGPFYLLVAIMFAAGVSFSFSSSSRLLASFVPLGLVVLAFLLPFLSSRAWGMHLETVTPLFAILIAAMLSLATSLVLGFKRDLRVAGTVTETSVLFGDIVGSTTSLLSKGSDAYHVEAERVLILAARTVERFHGNVERTLGDGFIATFTGEYGGMHAVRAVKCAQAISNLLDDGAKSQQSDTHMRFGIESGPVTGGFVVEHGERTWSSTGRAVTLAQRIQASCAELGIRIGVGPVAAALVETETQLREAGTIRPKGFDQTVAVFCIE